MWQVERGEYIAGGAALIKGVSLAVKAGEFLAICGPNGAGKSTLLHLLSGALRPTRGTVTFLNQPLSRWNWRELAQQRAVLGQEQTANFPLTAADIVALGREPWAGRDAAELVPQALAQTDAGHLAARLYPSLSGGERQRVQLARVLVQMWGVSPGALLLDEPLNHLDLAHQHGLLRVARQRARKGAAVVIVLHDVNLALQYADRLALLRGGELVACDGVAELADAACLSAVFGVPLRRFVSPEGVTWMGVV